MGRLISVNEHASVDAKSLIYTPTAGKILKSRLCASFHGVCASRAGRPAPLRSALKSRIARNFRRRKDTRHSQSENGADFQPNPASGELSPVSFEGRKPTFSRGNWTMCEEKSQIAQTLRLYGGPGRDRTDDLFHAISKGELRRSGTEQNRATLRGSVHAGFVYVHCFSCVPE